MATSPQPGPLPQSSGDETSPFSMLKGRYEFEHSDDQGFILRTRSLDEGSTACRSHGDPEHRPGQHADQEETGSASASAALHSSFDVAMLHDRSGSPYFSEDDEEQDRSGSLYEDSGDLSGKKHLRPKTALEASLEVNPSGTVRKQPKRAVADSKTPARPRLRPPGAMKKSANATPSSAAKRRRAHWCVGESPISGVMPPTTQFHPAPLTSPPTTNFKLDGSIFGEGRSSFALSPPAMTPNLHTGPFGTAKSMSKWHNTGTTATVASTLLETPLESSSDSVDTASPTTMTRFRFTSFPASLPRVNNPRSRECPASLRKRIPFAENPSLSSDVNQSRDDDGTQNTSVSSLSAEGHHQHLAPAPGALSPAQMHTQPPPVEEEPDEDSMRPIHARLFEEDEVFGYSDDDDDTESSPFVDMVGRTRLNFNNALTPHKDCLGTKGEGAEINCVDLANPYEQRRINSFPSSLSSHTHMNNLSGCEVVGGGFSPARQSDQDLHGLTPREVQLHFPLEDYSPIPGFKEDPGRCEVMHDPLPSSSDRLLDGLGVLPGRKMGASLTSIKSSDQIMKDEMSSSTGSGSGSMNGKSRRLRPLPDMTAFESHALSSSRGDRSSDDSATLDSKGLRLTCPPTPVRTPAWANEGGALARYGRQSSLITTKVLLSVPSQVVKGRSSLENSVLDDDSKASASRFPGIVNRSAAGQKQGGTTKGDKINIRDMVAPSLTAGRPEEADVLATIPQLQGPPRLMRRVPPRDEADSVISFSNDFEILGALGSGSFADVYKVRSIRDNRLYAVKRNRRQFRGKRDRDMALAEVQAMQRLESVCAETGTNSLLSTEKNSYCLYLLFFYRAWQEDGYFFCQTELCCRDTCREFLDSLRFLWNTSKNRYPSLLRYITRPSELAFPNQERASVRLVPTDTVWKIFHDIAAGLSHIHSHGMVHHDIKPSNIFFVAHPRFGAMCKIGDFGMAGEIGSVADGLEGDTRYMPPELLALGARHPSADIFSLGLTVYEISTDQITEMPTEGPQWHFLRSSTGPTLPNERGDDLLKLVQAMTDPNETKRPTADSILKSQKVIDAGRGCDHFLKDYINDIEAFDQMEEARLALECHNDQTPRNISSHRSVMQVQSPSLSMIMSKPPNLLSPVANCIN